MENQYYPQRPTEQQILALISKIHSNLLQTNDEHSTSITRDSIPDQIKKKINELDQQKSKSQRFSHGNTTFLLDVENEKNINTLKSYQQRVYTYAGTACLLLDLIEIPQNTTKKAIQKKISALADKYSEQAESTATRKEDAKFEYDFKKSIAEFTTDLCRILGKETHADGYPLGLSRAADWLIKLEHWYVASLGIPPHQVAKFVANETTFYHVTEYKPSHVSEELHAEYLRILTPDKPAWYTFLTPPEQRLLYNIVLEDEWEKLEFLPSILDRVPGLRNIRSTKLFRWDAETKQPVLIDTSYASASRVPIGVKDSNERMRLNILNIKDSVRSENDKPWHFLNLMTPLNTLVEKIFGSKDGHMIREQQKAIAHVNSANEKDLNKKHKKHLHSNLAVNMFNRLAASWSWEGIDAVIDLARTAMDQQQKSENQKAFINALIDNLESVESQHPLLQSKEFSFAAAYAGILADIFNIDTIFNCKSGKDRTGYILALKQTIRAYHSIYQKLPSIDSLIREEEPLSTQFAAIFCPIYVQNAKSAGYNSPGCDDLKMATIPMPVFLKAALQAGYPFYKSGVSDMNRPSPKFSLSEKIAAMFAEWGFRLKKFFSRDSTLTARPPQAQELLSNQPTEHTALLANDALQLSVSSANEQPQKQPTKTFAQELNAVLVTQSRHNDYVNAAKRLITALAYSGLANPKNNQPFYHYLTGTLTLKFDNPSSENMMKFLNYILPSRQEQLAPTQLAAKSRFFKTSYESKPTVNQLEQYILAQKIKQIRALGAIKPTTEKDRIHRDAKIARIAASEKTEIAKICIPCNEPFEIKIEQHVGSDLLISFNLPAHIQRQQLASKPKVLTLTTEFVNALGRDNYPYQREILLDSPDQIDKEACQSAINDICTP